MEQQPGPVNWAPYNPDPLPGMARLWAWEAFAHAAEAMVGGDLNVTGQVDDGGVVPASGNGGG